VQQFDLHSRFCVASTFRAHTLGTTFNGSLELTWNGEPFKGIACKLDSPGYAAICKATEEVRGGGHYQHYQCAAYSYWSDRLACWLASR
jgi:hypothetical protein